METGDEVGESTLLKPLTKSQLRDALDQMHLGVRLEEAFACLLQAGISLGFAREAVPVLSGRAEELRGPITSALDHLSESLAQKAVLDASATYDASGTRKDFVGGASSLANATKLVKNFMEYQGSASDEDREAAQKLVDELSQSVDPNKESPEWKAIRYWRNKWAAHRSVEAQVDPWAWENSVDFKTIEKGLKQRHDTFNEFAVLLTQLPELASIGSEARRVDDSRIRMGISLEGTSRWPVDFVTAIGEEQARAFLDTLALTDAP